MRLWLPKAGIAALALAGSVAMPATAVATPTDATFNGGSLSGLAVDPVFTQGSFQNLTYRQESCGTESAEANCTWEVQATLYSDPASRCKPSTPETQVIWASGAISGNGSMEAGPVSFALEGCRGQILGGYVKTTKTFNPDEQEGPWKVVGRGWSASLFSIGIGAESVKEAEQKIIEASPPAQPASPALPQRLAISADCRSLKIGVTRYAFVFRRMGCHKAANLATMAYLSGAAPGGYRCGDKPGGGMRCSRQAQPKKYVEWHILRPAAGRGPATREPD
jgi:hypothetical protein